MIATNMLHVRSSSLSEFPDFTWTVSVLVPAPLVGRENDKKFSSFAIGCAFFMRRIHSANPAWAIFIAFSCADGSATGDNARAPSLLREARHVIDTPDVTDALSFVLVLC